MCARTAYSDVPAALSVEAPNWKEPKCPLAATQTRRCAPSTGDADGSCQSQLRAPCESWSPQCPVPPLGFREKAGAEFVRGSSPGSRTDRCRVQPAPRVSALWEVLPGWLPACVGLQGTAATCLLSLGMTPRVIPARLLSPAAQVRLPTSPQRFTEKTFKRRESWSVQWTPTSH